VVAVTDDGSGGARMNGGSGLRGLADRVAALGGTMVVESGRGRGMVVTAELPCGFVIVEDQALLRRGLFPPFEDAGHEVLAQLPDAVAPSDVVRRTAPDLVVLDVRMPPTFTDEGARAAIEIKHAHPDVGVLLLSQHVETTRSVHLVRLGGFGYLLKDRVLDVDDFLSAAARSPREDPRSTHRSWAASWRPPRAPTPWPVSPIATGRSSS
jgi:ActR/RegA family two-component response regulator